MAEEVERHSRRNRLVTVEEGCYTHKVLLVVAAGHNHREDHNFVQTVVEASVREEGIRLGCSLQKGIQVEVSVFEEGSRRNRHHRDVGRRSHPGQDNRTLP